MISQGYPNLEYFIVDGGSTDGTIEIIRSYESALSGWISEPDNGMYDALNKGFAVSSGEIMGWISATDRLHPGSLSVVGGVFHALPSTEWITGRPTALNQSGVTVSVGDIPHWSRYRFLAGANRHIQQESTFWRRSLWEKAGSSLDASRRFSSDFDLWVRFFRHARLHPVDALVGGFRFHEDSLGLQHYTLCQQIQNEIIEKELRRMPAGAFLRAFRRVWRMAMATPVVRYLWWKAIERNLYRMPGPDWPELIFYDHTKGWVMENKRGTGGQVWS